MSKWIQRYLDPYNRGKQKLFVEFFLTGHDIKLLLQGNLNSDGGHFSISKNSFPTLVEHQSGLTLIRINNKPIY